MKEIIYLDTKLVNSLLAQLNTGLVTKEVNELSNNTTRSDGTSETSSESTNLSGGIKILNAEKKVSVSYSNKKDLVLSEGNKNFMEIALDDYSLEVLIKNLEDNSLIIKKDIKDGDILLEKGKLAIYNFEYLKNITNIEILKDIIPDYKEFLVKFSKFKKLDINSKVYKEKKRELEGNTWYPFKEQEYLATYGEKLFSNTTLMKIDKYLSLCDNDYLRLNYSQLFFRNFSEKEFFILGIIISKRTKDNSLTFLPDASESQQPRELKQFPGLVCDLVLASSDIIQIDDFIIRPIAIYSEWENIDRVDD